MIPLKSFIFFYKKNKLSTSFKNNWHLNNYKLFYNKIIMKNKEFINQQVEDTFKVLDSIEKVEVNHFFKHKVLQKLNVEKEVKQSMFSWFTPQLQLATLAIMLFLNVGTLFYVFNNSIENSNTTSEIEAFAQEYSLQSETTSILN